MIDAAERERIWQQCNDVLYKDYDDSEEFFNKKPLIAHYTSLENLENIFRSGELWFSNPIFMNDHQEVQFVIETANQVIRTFVSNLDLCDEVKDNFIRQYNNFESIFTSNELLDCYVFCTSLHNKEDTDGKLAMWRGYGANGNGVALVLDCAKIEQDDSMPFLILKVKYTNQSTLTDFLNEKIKAFFDYILHSPDRDFLLDKDNIYIPAANLFDYIKVTSLIVKNEGFEEEKEWRVIYIKDRDTKKYFEKFFGYTLQPNGFVPKLKLNLSDEEIAISLEFITDRIILGPCSSTRINKEMMKRMLNKFNNNIAEEKIVFSSIPYRSTK